MSAESKLLRKKSKKLTEDQMAVLKAYLSPGGRVCVDAGAGTGKTTTLIETLAEVVLRELESRPNGNPMERILAVSFGVEASRKLKTELKRRLRDHEEAGGKLPQEIWRHIECESYIQTIDAYMQSLLREIALRVGISPTFDIPTGLEQDGLVQEVLEGVISDPHYKEKWSRLQEAFPSRDFWDFAPENLRDMVWNSHQKSREFCLDIDEVRERLIDSVKKVIHCGKTPPFGLKDLAEIVENLSNGIYRLSCQSNSESDLIEYATDSYNRSLELAEDLGDILIAFDKEYNRLTKERGWLTYIDITYLVWKYTKRDHNKDWIASLKNRFDNILVDEFQDTSHVQFEVIKCLVRTGNTNSRNRVMIIGDVKQSIYQWRSAEPQIFAGIIHSLKSQPPAVKPPLEGMVYCALTSNFRSHPQLIDLFNGIFSNLFSDEARGAISGEVPYVPLEAKVNVGKDEGPRIHVCINDGGAVGAWVSKETARVTEVIRGILRPTSGIMVRDGEESVPAQAGDITLLFRRNRNIPRYVNALRASGINCSVQTDISLFSEREVSLIIDFLDWLANPESRDSITRILRSPLVAMSDKTLRYLASERFLLVRALQKWKPELGLPSEDKVRLDELLKLRNDLRWDREGPKAALIEKIIANSCLDSVVLASEEGIQAQANLWMLVEVISSWEEEELLPYREFVEILKQLRERARNGIERDYPRAILADEKSKDSVRLMTVHAAKGLEFPIVIIPEAIVSVNESKRMDRIVRNREIGIILRPRPGQSFLPPGVMIARENLRGTIAWASNSTEESILWLSPTRDNSDGTFLVDSPIAKAVSNEAAEFWRILYVAATRARDHLIFSCGDGFDYREWSSWMRFLRKSLSLENINGGGIHKIGVSWIDDDGTLIQREVNIGVDDFSAEPSLMPSPFPSITPTGTQTPYDSGCPSFVPFKINPSTFPILLECPRRYQYGIVWKTSGLRMPTGATGAVPPSNMSAEKWGNEVHEALRLRNHSVDLSFDVPLLNILKRYPLNVKKELEEALRNFSNLPIGRLVNQAAIKKRKIFKEQKLNCLFSFLNPPLLVNGQIDLLFQSEHGEWVLVDFKAEEEPEIDSYRSRIHKTQLDAYAWMIERTLGLSVSKAFLAYVHPKSSQQQHIPDTKRFEKTALSILKSLKVDTIHGLEAKPAYGQNGTCPSCPYSKSVGGPCEH